MEFEPSQPRPNSPEDTSTGRIIRVNDVAPLHEQSVVAEATDASIGAQHFSTPATATNDVEYVSGDTRSNPQPKRAHHMALIASISVSVLLAASVTYAFLVLA